MDGGLTGARFPDRSAALAPWRMCRVAAALAGLAAVLAVAGCGSGSANSSGNLTKVLRIAYQADMNTFDPDNGFEVAGLGAIRAAYEGLVQYEPGTTTLTGLLAKSWTISPDGITYTFTLQSGVRFHDGTPMTSQSVKDSFMRRINDQTLATSYFLANVKSIATPDPQTLMLTLSQPQPSLLDGLASAWGPKVIGPSALKNHAGTDDSKSYLNEHEDGTGPFQLTRFARGQGYTLQRFNGYWGTPPKLNTIDISIIPDIGQQILQLQSGAIDMVEHGYPFEQLKNIPSGLTVVSYHDLGIETAAINTAGKLKDINARRAVAAALNPQGWLTAAFGTYADPALSLFPTTMIKAPTPYTYPSGGSSSGIPSLTIAYTADDVATQSRVADLLIAQMHSAGIESSAHAVPLDQALAYAKNPAAAPADIYISNNLPDDADPGSAATLFYGTGGGVNWFGYSNPGADNLFTQASTLTDHSQRDSLYLNGTQLVLSDFAFLPLASIRDVIVYKGHWCDLNTIPAVPWNVSLNTVRAC